MQSYLALLREELRDAEQRLARADPEGVPVILAQIREISRDIKRNSAKSESSDSRFLGVPVGFAQGTAHFPRIPGFTDFAERRKGKR